MSRDGARWTQSFILLTCEHGGRDVPAAYRPVFDGQEAVLESHRGYDIGALGVALRMASGLSAPIIHSTVTRLLVDLNRSLDHPGVWSEFTRELPVREREVIAEAFYTPHRESVWRTVAAAVAVGHRVLHVGVHSCADELAGVRRDLDIALLFDDARVRETDFCRRWRAELAGQAGHLRYRFNEPYRGADDGLTTTLRARFDPADYLGIEVELRQGMVRRGAEQDVMGDLLASSLMAIAPISGVRLDVDGGP